MYLSLKNESLYLTDEKPFNDLNYIKLNIDETLDFINSYSYLSKDNYLFFYEKRALIYYWFKKIAPVYDTCKCKLVRFPKTRKIKLCSVGNTKHNYKNTLIIPNSLISMFKEDADNNYELFESNSSYHYKVWSNIIDKYLGDYNANN